MSYIKSIITAIKSVLIFTILFLILFIPLSIIYIVKIFIILTAKIFSSDLTPLTPNDIMAGAVDNFQERPILNLGFLMEIQGRIKVEDLREKFSDCFLKKEAEGGQCQGQIEGNLLSYISTFGGYSFKKRVKSIDLEDHIKNIQIDLEEEGAIENFVNKFLYKGYPPNKPYWEIALISSINSITENYEKTFLIFKIHHVLADGKSLIYIMDKLMEMDISEPILGKNIGFLSKILLFIKAPMLAIEMMGKIGQFPSPTLITPGKLQEFNLHFISLNLPLIKEIRKKTGVRILSILHAVQGGAIRRFLLESQKMEEEDLPEFIISSSSLPGQKRVKHNLGNNWSAGLFKVPIKNSNGKERLKLLNEEIEEFYKSGTLFALSSVLSPILGLFPNCVTKTSMSKDPGVRFSFSPVVVLNKKECKIFGRKVNHVYPLLGFNYLTCITLAISHSSDKMDLLISPSTEFLKNREDGKIFINYFHEEIDLLAKECGI